MSKLNATQHKAALMMKRMLDNECRIYVSECAYPDTTLSCQMRSRRVFERQRFPLISHDLRRGSALVSRSYLSIASVQKRWKYSRHLSAYTTKRESHIQSINTYLVGVMLCRTDLVVVTHW